LDIRVNKWQEIGEDCIICNFVPCRHQIKHSDTGEACSPMGVMRNAYSMLIGKAEGKRPLKRPGPGMGG